MFSYVSYVVKKYFFVILVFLVVKRIVLIF